ncbi:MAG: hypothetical protein R2712_28870 [Vicinamibacterales bacterium]
MSPARRAFRVRLAVLVLVGGVAAGLAWAAWNMRDRAPGAAFSLDVRPGQAAPGACARVRAPDDQPDLSRPVWLAGFARGRAATGIHDDLEAVALVIDDGEHRLGIVAVDAIGVFHDQVVAIRARVPASARLDYVVVAATHDHSAPDLMGIWGPGDVRSGYDESYRALVVDGAAGALADAAAALTPSVVSFAEVPLEPQGLVADSRDPQVFDATMRLMHFAAPDGRTLGTLVNWADHPETPWSANTEITADFPGYLRRALEHGVSDARGGAVPGLGGTHVYVNGAIGGLMTTNPETEVTDPFTGRTYGPPSHEKAEALGRSLARVVFDAVAGGGASVQDAPRLSISAHTLDLQVDNPLFTLGIALGVFGRGQPRWGHIRSEVAVVTFGDASIACVPGELYPEIANGGIVRPAGADFAVEPVEVPPLRALMPRRFRFLFGLANDEIGYIIPRSEWDDEPPWLYGAPERHYGEINSLGPDTGPTVHRALADLLRRVSALTP